MDKSASTLSLYSNIVRGDTDFEDSPRWLRKYQQEDEENALKRAIEESVKVTISVEKWKCHYINWSVLQGGFFCFCFVFLKTGLKQDTDSSDDSLLEVTGGFSSTSMKVLNVQPNKTLTSGRWNAMEVSLRLYFIANVKWYGITRLLVSENYAKE